MNLLRRILIFFLATVLSPFDWMAEVERRRDDRRRAARHRDPG
jgi:hypothetical protein